RGAHIARCHDGNDEVGSADACGVHGCQTRLLTSRWRRCAASGGQSYFGSLPGCWSSRGNACAPLLLGRGAAGAGGGGAAAASRVVTSWPRVLELTAAMKRLAASSLVVTLPFMMSLALTPLFL